jgi:hypothetical protein
MSHFIKEFYNKICLIISRYIATSILMFQETKIVHSVSCYEPPSRLLPPLKKTTPS